MIEFMRGHEHQGKWLTVESMCTDLFEGRIKLQSGDKLLVVSDTPRDKPNVHVGNVTPFRRDK